MANVSTFQRANVKDRQPFKAKPPRAWSHQDDLKANVGKTMRLMFVDEVVIQGTLVTADQFTLKIARSDKSVVTYFKSGMISFEVIA
jgi:hypothetical protein